MRVPGSFEFTLYYIRLGNALMPKRYFITGTDTSVGKTVVTVGLLETLNRMGMSTVALKPVASGCDPMDAGLRNADALALQRAASIKLPYELVNPFAFQPAIAPHIAAQQQGITLTVKGMAQACKPAFDYQSDFMLVEGAGGWLVPLNEKETIADFVKTLNIPVILVVAIRLGCLNHAILTYQSIIEKGLPIIAWVANCISADTSVIQQNIQTLQQWFDAPLLAQIDYEADLSACFKLNTLERLFLAD